jgi:hypothetical protein
MRPQNRGEADETGGRKIGLIGHEPFPSLNDCALLLLKNRAFAEFGYGQTEFG